jgi:hypothetical protein
MPTTIVEKHPTRQADLHLTIERVCAEFVEMPGLRLTTPQVQRLFGVDKAVCNQVLDALVALEVLRKNRDGTYSRLVE